MNFLSSIETNYSAAKARLQAAQQEKLEAAAEFLAARAALHQTLETFWAEEGETAPMSGYDRATYGKPDSRQRTACALL